MTQRVLVVGADAAGMSAAHQALRTAKRLGRDLTITVAEKSQHTSYSACGIPYWIAGDVDSGDDLIARSADEHRESGIDLRLGAEVVGVGLATRTATVRVGGAVETWTYDDLVVASGAHAIVPDWAYDADGSLVPGVGPVKTLDDGAAWLDRMAARPEGRLVIVGGGYIGVEMAETAVRRGYAVTLVTRTRVLSDLDPDMSRRVTETLERAGVDVRGGAEVIDLRRDADGVITGVDTTVGAVEAALVVVAVGVEPSTGFLAGQLPVDDEGYLLPDPQGRVAPGVWAAGDCVAVVHRLTGRRAPLALGTHANKLGRAMGDALAGGDLHFDGALGSVITRFAAAGEYLEVATTGLTTLTAAQAGFDPVSVLTEGTTASGYLADEAEPIAIQVIADRASRRLLGVQILGGRGAGKRIDTAAAVLWAEGSVDDLAWMDLSYAPPFATAWEILQVAARRVAERL